MGREIQDAYASRALEVQAQRGFSSPGPEPQTSAMLSRDETWQRRNVDCYLRLKAQDSVSAKHSLLKCVSRAQKWKQGFTELHLPFWVSS